MIRCPTKYAVLLLAIRGADGVFRFPSNETPLPPAPEQPFTPGLILEAKPLLGIFEQLTSLSVEFLKLKSATGLDIRADFAEPLPRVSDEHGTLFVGSWEGPLDNFAALPDLTPLPQMIRSMGRRRERVAYLKAWQILSGAASEITVAIEASELGSLLKGKPDHDE